MTATHPPVSDELTPPQHGDPQAISDTWALDPPPTGPPAPAPTTKEQAEADAIAAKYVKPK